MPHEIGVFVRSAAELDRARGAVEKAGLAFKVLDEKVETISGHVSIGTMHLAKGLEFRAVAVMACDDEVIPLQERIETVADDADLEEVYNTERHLLYVACTRARDHLLVTAVAPASEFLDDLRMCLNKLLTEEIDLAEPKPPIVEIRNLSKSYHRESLAVPVLHDITFDIAEGEFLALMGPSGSGKTTLLNLLAGIDKADSGTIRVGDVDITALSETELAHWRANNVGFIFQFYNLIPVLKAVENVELPLHLTALSRRERLEHAEMALRMVGLEHRMDHYPKEMSGGEQQRVAIARAIVTDPTLLVADEPTGDLDRVSAEEILTMMERLNAEMGKTIVMVTHDPRAAQRAKVMRILDKGYLNDAPAQNPL